MNWKSLFTTLLRIAVGWHFLFEGISKLVAEKWSAEPYLAGSVGFLSGFYHWLASSPALVGTVNFLNIAGLIVIGLCLSLGVATRLFAGLGFFLLMLYYFAYPPFGASVMMQPEGSLYIVNKQLIEAMVLLLFVFLKDRGWSIDRLRAAGRRIDSSGRVTEGGRREWIKNLASIPVLGLTGYGAFQNKRTYGLDVMSGATIQLERADISELKGELPKGKLGEHEISRLVAGGNLIGGWAHARDLKYVSSLFKAYNTEKKVFETLILAEKAGINSINIGFPSNPLLQKYKKVTGSKIKVISQVAPDKETGDLFLNIDRAIDYGADIIQVQGNQSDWMVRDGKTENLGKMLDHIRKQGYTAGLGAHSVDALIAAEEMGIIPDYYMKTMHHDKYWSAHPREKRVNFEVDGKNHPEHDRFHNNIFCLWPDKTVEFVNRVKVPVMGFKVLAAGALKPEDGFRWAFENGADWICVGMFDFQIVKDVNITINILNDLPNRKREWYA
jgi:uncharacterized membrane protein YphA (DoxX/SURF4 family)